VPWVGQLWLGFAAWYGNGRQSVGTYEELVIKLWLRLLTVVGNNVMENIYSVIAYGREFVDIHTKKHKHEINMKAFSISNLKQSAPYEQWRNLMYVKGY